MMGDIGELETTRVYCFGQEQGYTHEKLAETVTGQGPRGKVLTPEGVMRNGH